MLKIAMVTVYPEISGVIRGGVEGVAYNLCRELVDMGDVELHVIAPSNKKTLQVEVRDGLTIYWLAESKYMPGFISFWTTYRWSIHQCLAQINPDITHFQGVAGWALGYTKPYVLTIHGITENDVLFSKMRFLYMRYKIVAWVERAARRRCKNIILISPYVMDELSDQIKGNHWSIENPVSQVFFDVIPRQEEKIILYVGRINERKNVKGLIRAFNKVHQHMPEVTLRIGGPLDEDNYGLSCIALVDKLQLTEAVVFLRSLNRTALLTELSRARCLALVSHQETAPMVVEEAMAAGVPVVASHICGLPFMIDNGKTGFLVDQNNEDEIADRLEEVLNSHNDSTLNMARESREVAAARFHSKVVAVKTLEIYKKVMFEDDKN
jgi:glycosyltransferase involved in cell wall biosynthesis